MNFRFPKTEKLKSTTTIERLFTEGKSFTKFPVKMFYLELKEKSVSQAAFAVPKRNFKSAVSRNRIKRQLREVYRLNKGSLITNNGRNFALLFLYIGKSKPQQSELETSVKLLFKKLNDENN
jgi:ribonuclease P protein component